MKLSLDTANIEHIREAKRLTRQAGKELVMVTTNPSLIKQERERRKGRGEIFDIENCLREIIKEGLKVSVEVTSDEYREMVIQGINLFGRFERQVYIKIPICTSQKYGEKPLDGLWSIYHLSCEGIPVNCTLIHTPVQALLAARAGASIVSPFVGRIDDYLKQKAGLPYEGKHKWESLPPTGLRRNGVCYDDKGVVSGVHLVKIIAELFKRERIKTKILAASLRTPEQVVACEEAGADIATMPYNVFSEYLENYLEIKKKFMVFPITNEEMISKLLSLPRFPFEVQNLEALLWHEKTGEGVERFLSDASEVPEYNGLFQVRSSF